MKKLIVLMLVFAMVLPMCIVANAEDIPVLIPIPTPEEGKSFFEQVDPDREIYVSEYGYSEMIIYMKPIEITPDTDVNDLYTSYSASNGYFPEFYGYSYDHNPADTDHSGSRPINVTWQEGSENLKNRKAGSGVFCPMYRITYNTAEYTAEEFIALFDGREDIYFIEPTYEDNHEYFITVYSALGAPSAWYWYSVKYAVDKGIMNGYTADYDLYKDGEYLPAFRPNDPITRAQFVQILYNMKGNGEKVDVEMPFDDVSEDDWFYDAMRWAYKNKLIAGMTKFTVEPHTTINREMAVTILYRYAQEFGYSTRVQNPIDLSDYIDLNEISSWAKTPAIWAAKGGLMNGWEIFSGCLHCGNVSVWAPQDECTRAQIAKIAGDFYRYHNVYAPESGLTQAEFYDMLHNR